MTKHKVLFANSQAILTREKKAEEKSRVRKTFPANVFRPERAGNS
jgi:hypothetical protein